VFNITANNIHVYNLTIRCKTLTHIRTSFGLLHLYFLYIFSNISFSVEYVHVTGVFFVVEEKRRIFHAFLYKVFNFTANNIHVYNLTIRCKTLTHDAKYPHLDYYIYIFYIYSATFHFLLNMYT
jgi:hypothetical protein